MALSYYFVNPEGILFALAFLLIVHYGRTMGGPSLHQLLSTSANLVATSAVTSGSTVPVCTPDQVTTVPQWIEWSLNIASTISYVHDLPQVLSFLDGTQCAHWQTCSYQTAQIIILASHAKFSHTPFATLTRANAKVIIAILDDILHHFDKYACSLGVVVKTGPGGPRAKLTYLMIKLCHKYSWFPMRLHQRGITIWLYQVSGGGYSDVHKGRRHGKYFAVKELREHILNKGKPDFARRCFFQEVITWAYISHEHILPFQGIMKNTREQSLPYLVSPWIDRGSVRSCVNTTSIPPQTILEWLAEIADGLDFVHSCGIVHRDVRGSNILIGSCGQALIADFGTAHIIDSRSRQPLTRSGSPPWMAPEVLYATLGRSRTLQQTPTPAGDVWALGCTTIELFMGGHPWETFSDVTIIIMLAEGRRPASQSDQIEDMPAALWDVINKTWLQEPEGRPSMKQVKQSIRQILDFIQLG